MRAQFCCKVVNAGLQKSVTATRGLEVAEVRIRNLPATLRTLCIRTQHDNLASGLGVERQNFGHVLEIHHEDDVCLRNHFRGQQLCPVFDKGKADLAGCSHRPRMGCAARNRMQSRGNSADENVRARGTLAENSLGHRASHDVAKANEENGFGGWRDALPLLRPHAHTVQQTIPRIDRARLSSEPKKSIPLLQHGIGDESTKELLQSRLRLLDLMHKSSGRVLPTALPDRFQSAPQQLHPSLVRLFPLRPARHVCSRMPKADLPRTAPGTPGSGSRPPYTCAQRTIVA